MGERSGMLEQATLRLWRAFLTTTQSIAALAYLWLQAAVMSGSALPAAGAAVGAVLTESHFGLAWSVGFLGALVAASSCYFGRRGFPLFVVGLLAYAAGKAASSHAADSCDFSLRETIHVVHLVDWPLGGWWRDRRGDPCCTGSHAWRAVRPAKRLPYAPRCLN
jgi:putative copper export protein